jgi:hypothetical protein
MRSARTACVVLVTMLASATPAAAITVPLPGPACLTQPVPAASKAPRPLRFGITPLLAGTSGAAQEPVVPEDQRRTDAALRALDPRGRRLVMRINRVFESDGQRGIDRAVALARHYARLGFEVESQVRYHPSDAQNGDIAAWLGYVRRATRALARNRRLVALTITNEVNFPISANTSDGAYRNALDALVQGVVAAHRELGKAGRRNVAVGFSYAYRYLPSSDDEFWRGIGQRATAAFRRALDYVGVQLYPGLVYPPVLAPGQSGGDATLDALALVRDCYMPLAGLTSRVHLWVTENGYATKLGHTETEQAQNLRSTVEALHRYSGTFGVTDYRYFNLRDNVPAGADLFDNVGLLRSDYSRKPAFSTYRRLIAAYGVRWRRRPPPAGAAALTP